MAPAIVSRPSRRPTAEGAALGIKFLGVMGSSVMRGVDIGANSAAGDTISLFRKMSTTEADATLNAMKLQPAIPGANSSKYLSDSMGKVEKFQNNGVLGTPQTTLEFVLDKPGYESMMSSSVNQAGSKGIDAVKVNFEGIDPTSNLRNIGVPASQIDLFNSLIRNIKPAGQ